MMNHHRHHDEDEEEKEAGYVLSLSSYNIFLIATYFAIAASNKSRQVKPLRGMDQSVSLEKITKVYHDKGFRPAFRMERKTFYKLLRLIAIDLSKSNEMGMRSGRLVIPPDVRLAITLRLLAGASYLDLQTSYRAGGSTVYEVFHSICNALMNQLRLPGLPRTVEGLRESSMIFKLSRSAPSPLSECVGALDGIAVKIKMPKRHERPAAYYCRKGYYSLPVQALCDSRYMFLTYSAKCVGSTHDSIAHMVSSLGMYLDQGMLQKEFWAACDEAYQPTESLIPPYPNSRASTAQKHFNYFLSVLRVHIEQAFGMLVARWRIVRDGLEFNLRANCRIFFVHEATQLLY